MAGFLPEKKKQEHPPLTQGKFDLNSMIMKIQTKEKDPGIRRLFWDDPFFDTFSQRTKARILVSEQKTINVSMSRLGGGTKR